MQLSDFDFDLPKALIASYPLATRSASRLFDVSAEQAALRHRHFMDLDAMLDEGDLLIFNDTRVFPARLYGKKTTGGRVEILIERILDQSTCLAQLRVSKALKCQDVIHLVIKDQQRASDESKIFLQVIEREGQFYRLHLEHEQLDFLTLLKQFGEVPLPPYMERQAEENDKERYQTIYAKHDGSVAAPTAGLHFDEALFSRLRKKNIEFAYVSLHVGAGTFSPVRVSNILDHRMHAEYCEVSSLVCDKIKQAKQRGKRIIAVGTTTLRALESAVQNGELKPYCGDTSIFIYPGHVFHSADYLITNFHLPQSTLLMLVAAFAGYDRIMRAYHEAIALAYRFYSYGDAMWLNRI